MARALARSVAKAGFALADLVLPAPGGPRLLIYHQVGAGLGRQMEVEVDIFGAQLDWLVRNREVVALEQAVDRWGDPGSDRQVVLTFDDGYRDTYTTAFPLMADLGLPFTLYLATESIDRQVALGPVPGAEPLTWAQIEEMLASGLLTVGGHTHRHTDLRHLSEAQVEEELGTSQDLIESRLGIRSKHFAYPWGYWSPAADGPVRRHYETAVLGGSPRPRSLPPHHEIHRYPVQLGDGFLFFRARVRGGLRTEEWMRRRVKGYRGP